MLEHYKLLARDGKPLADVELPHFDRAPDVVMWGTRTFIRSQYNRFEYTEATVAWAPVKRKASS